jgi:Flp pilus assembly protein TadG
MASSARAGAAPPRTDGGAVAVEAALITPLLMLMLFGIVEVSLLIKDDLAVSAAARAGARTGSALPRFDDGTTDFAQQAADQVATAAGALDLTAVSLTIYAANAAGDPQGGGTPVDCSDQCVHFRYDVATSAFVRDGGSWPASTINACPGDPAQDAIAVYVSYPHRMPLFGGTVTLTDRSVMAFEPVSPTQGCK